MHSTDIDRIDSGALETYTSFELTRQYFRATFCHFQNERFFFHKLFTHKCIRPVWMSDNAGAVYKQQWNLYIVWFRRRQPTESENAMELHQIYTHQHMNMEYHWTIKVGQSEPYDGCAIDTAQHKINREKKPHECEWTHVQRIATHNENLENSFCGLLRNCTIDSTTIYDTCAHRVCSMWCGTVCAVVFLVAMLMVY